MARSLLRQLEQIRRSATYDDAVVDVFTSAVAEPTVSGSLEQDMNVFRTLMKDIKGTTNWFDEVPKYFDPKFTDAGSTASGVMNLFEISGKTTDAQTIIVAVEDDYAGSGYAVTTASSGILVLVATRYATSANRTGLPIFASETGDYHDEGGDLRICRVDIVDMDTGEEIDSAGSTVYGVLVDGLDFGGSGEFTDVFIQFYADSSPITMVSGISDIKVVYPQRRVMSDVEEWEWLRTDFVSSWEGDIELIEDISNLWSFTGAGDNITSPTWTSTGANYILFPDPSDLEGGINALNDGIGDRSYIENNYISDNDPISTSLDDLDKALNDIAEAVEAGVGEKYIESVSVPFSAGTLHSLPTGITYTPDSTAGREGSNMDVYVDGQLIAADTIALNDRDYAETTTSGITFHFDIQVGRNITYIVRD